MSSARHAPEDQQATPIRHIGFQTASGGPTSKMYSFGLARARTVSWDPMIGQQPSMCRTRESPPQPVFAQIHLEVSGYAVADEAGCSCALDLPLDAGNALECWSDLPCTENTVLMIEATGELGAATVRAPRAASLSRLIHATLQATPPAPARYFLRRTPRLRRKTKPARFTSSVDCQQATPQGPSPAAPAPGASQSRLSR